MKIWNLIENTEGNAGCATEHGLCLYIETARHRLLMDVGASDLLMENADKLGIDLAKVDTVVISHGHYDHGGGFSAFFSVNHTAKVYMQKTAADAYFFAPNKKEPSYIGLPQDALQSEQIVWLEGDCRIDSELSLFTDIGAEHPIPPANRALKIKRGNDFLQDDFRHEQCLVIRQGRQKVLFSGCAHHGILNVLERYRQIYGNEPDVVISGFHLMKTHYSNEDAREIVQTAHRLRGFGSTFYTCHCTGTKPYQVMKRIMGDQLHYFHCGDEIEIPAIKVRRKGGKGGMKWHRFFAWATVGCFLMTMFTGYERK